MIEWECHPIFFCWTLLTYGPTRHVQIPPSSFALNWHNWLELLETSLESQQKKKHPQIVGFSQLPCLVGWLVPAILRWWVKKPEALAWKYVDSLLST